MTAHPAQLHPLVPLPEEVRALIHLYGAQLHEVPRERLISAFTQAQAGVVGRRQLIHTGMSARTVGRRLQQRQLLVRFRGVYAPGHLRLAVAGHRTAAVLAVPRSVLTHGSATELHGVGGAAHRWHVTVPGNGGRRVSSPEIAVHTSTTLRPEDFCVVAGVPCTTLERSIVDAAGHLSPRRLANVLARAERASLLHLSALRDALARVQHNPSQGHAALSAALDEHARLGAQLSRSEIETALHSIASQAGLAEPLLNRVVAGDEVDALWPRAGLGIEIDSWEFHRDRRSFVADRAKLRRLFLRGFVVLPYAAADVVHRPGLVAAELRAALARAPGDCR